MTPKEELLAKIDRQIEHCEKCLLADKYTAGERIIISAQQVILSSIRKSAEGLPELNNQ